MVQANWSLEELAARDVEALYDMVRATTINSNFQELADAIITRIQRPEILEYLKQHGTGICEESEIEIAIPEPSAEGMDKLLSALANEACTVISHKYESPTDGYVTLCFQEDAIAGYESEPVASVA